MLTDRVMEFTGDTAPFFDDCFAARFLDTDRSVPDPFGHLNHFRALLRNPGDPFECISIRRQWTECNLFLILKLPQGNRHFPEVASQIKIRTDPEDATNQDGDDEDRHTERQPFFTCEQISE